MTNKQGLAARAAISLLAVFIWHIGRLQLLWGSYYSISFFSFVYFFARINHGNSTRYTMRERGRWMLHPNSNINVANQITSNTNQTSTLDLKAAITTQLTQTLN